MLNKIKANAKTRYNAKTRRIAFALNIEQSERIKDLTQKEVNALAKMLFLQYIKQAE